MGTIKDFITEIGTVNRYSLLDRMRSDCNYYLGYGNRFKRGLWAGNVEDHIRFMKILWYILPINEKPQWISMADILDLEKRMK